MKEENINKKNEINYQILIPNLLDNKDNYNNNKDSLNKYNFETSICEIIPICNSCLFEFKPGNFICKTCNINICEIHLKSHNNKEINHKILKLIKKQHSIIS